MRVQTIRTDERRMNPVRFMNTIGAVSPNSMVTLIIFVFLLAVLGAAFTPILQTQVTSWQSNLTAGNQTAAATIVGLLPLIFWILIAVAIILTVVRELLPHTTGL